MIKAVIFDCFGVLTADLWKEFVATLPENQREPARELNRALDRGQLELKEFTREIHHLTGREPSSVEQTINHDITKNKKMFSLISELKDHYKVGLLSNVSTDWVREVFLTAEERAMFDVILLSYEVKRIKPDPVIYHAMCQRLGVEPQECVFVDDSEGNCTGAKDVGMWAIQYHDFEQCKRELAKLERDAG